jgi:hypothetical protein
VTLGSSPSGFTTHETKVHVACESELNNWQSWLVCLGTFLAEPAKFISRYFIKKPCPLQKKKSPQIGYTKSCCFLISSQISYTKNFVKNISKPDMTAFCVSVYSFSHNVLLVIHSKNKDFWVYKLLENHWRS